jgi:dihydrofolate reductase
MRVSIIVAAAENGVIGRGGTLPWHLADDLRRFKQLTMGHTIVMGRRTWESIARPLPGRRMIVVSRRSDYHAGDAQVVASLKGALSLAQAAGDSEALVIGGAELFREALSFAQRLYLTRVRAEVEGDTYLPEIDWVQWRLVESEPYAADKDNDFPFDFQIYDRTFPE